MNKITEALKMAIVALESSGGKFFDKEINACKEALESQEIGDAEIRQMLNDIEYYQKRVEELEQPAQEYDINEMIDKITPENLQEPVAWMLPNENLVNYKDVAEFLCEEGQTPIPLYTHPAQPLSDDEIFQIVPTIEQIKPQYGMMLSNEWNILDFARAIEQALKELNAKK